MKALPQRIEWPLRPPEIDARTLLQQAWALRRSRCGRLLVPAVLACFLSIGQGPAALLVAALGWKLTAIPASGGAETLRQLARGLSLAGGIGLAALHLLFLAQVFTVLPPELPLGLQPVSRTLALLAELPAFILVLVPVLTLLAWLREATGQRLRGLIPGTVLVAVGVRAGLALAGEMHPYIQSSPAWVLDRFVSLGMVLGWLPPLVLFLALARLGRQELELPIEDWAEGLRRMGLEVEVHGSMLEARGVLEGLPVDLCLDGAGPPARIALRLGLAGLEGLRIEARGPGPQAAPLGDPLLDNLLSISGPGAGALVRDQHATLLPVLRGRPGAYVAEGALVSGWTYGEDPTSWVAPETLLREAVSLGKALLSRKTLPGLAG